MKHNVYFEGKVQSLVLKTLDGCKATVGVITPGSYTFSAAYEEHIYIVIGSLMVKLPGEDWQEVPLGGKYVVPRRASFDVTAYSDVAYICYYKDSA